MAYLTGVIKRGLLASLRFGGSPSDMRIASKEFGQKESSGYITLPPDIALYDRLMELFPQTIPHEMVRNWADGEYNALAVLKNGDIEDFINAEGGVIINHPDAHRDIHTYLIMADVVNPVIICDLFRVGYWKSEGYSPISFEDLPSQMSIKVGSVVVIDGLSSALGGIVTDLVRNVASRARVKLFSLSVDPSQRADLLYPALSIINPTRFHNRRDFMRRFCDYEIKWHGYSCIRTNPDKIGELEKVLASFCWKGHPVLFGREEVEVELEEKHAAIISRIVKPESPSRFRTLATICPESLGYERFEPFTAPILSIVDKILSSSRKVLITCEENFYRRRLGQIFSSIAHPTERRKVISVVVSNDSPETYIDYHISASQDDDIVIADPGCSVWFRTGGRDEIRVEPLKITNLLGRVYELKILDPKGGETDEERICQTGENFQRAN